MPIKVKTNLRNVCSEEIIRTTWFVVNVLIFENSQTIMRFVEAYIPLCV